MSKKKFLPLEKEINELVKLNHEELVDTYYKRCSRIIGDISNLIVICRNIFYTYQKEYNRDMYYRREVELKVLMGKLDGIQKGGGSLRKKVEDIGNGRPLRKKYLQKLFHDAHTVYFLAMAYMRIIYANLLTSIANVASSLDLSTNLQEVESILEIEHRLEDYEFLYLSGNTYAKLEKLLKQLKTLQHGITELESLMINCTKLYPPLSNLVYTHLAKEFKPFVLEMKAKIEMMGIDGDEAEELLTSEHIDVLASSIIYKLQEQFGDIEEPEEEKEEDSWQRDMYG